MPEEIVKFTPQDLAILKDALRLVKATLGNPRRDSRGLEQDQYYTPEVYIARIPEPGIPPLGEELGSATIGKPSSLECEIYQLIGDHPLGQLSKLEAVTFRVYNIGTVTAEPGWAIAIRDKAGDWYTQGNISTREGTCQELPVSVSCESGALVVVTKYFWFPAWMGPYTDRPICRSAHPEAN